MDKRLEELTNYRKELGEEEECLQKALHQIQKQINVLEVEQLHLLNAVNPADSKNQQQEIPLNTKPLESKQLDLDVTSYVKKYTQEEEEEEEEEDDQL